MKKISLLLPMLLLASCNTKNETYTFDVKDHYTATLTSEVQEITHDMYLAHCKRGANECFIEVPLNDSRTELQLKFSGYVITYEVGEYTVSNNGWQLV